MKTKSWNVFWHITDTSQVTEMVAMATEFSQSHPWFHQVERMSWERDSCKMKAKWSTVFEISRTQKVHGRMVGWSVGPSVSPHFHVPHGSDLVGGVRDRKKKKSVDIGLDCILQANWTTVFIWRRETTVNRHSDITGYLNNKNNIHD